MTWNKSTSGTGATLVAAAAVSATAGSSMSVGDLIMVTLLWDKITTATSAIINDATNGNNKDNLGNTYSQIVVNSASAVGDIEIWMAVVEFAGTPTVRMRFGPTQGTSQVTYGSVNVDPFTGSDVNSVSAGSDNNFQNTSDYTATDAITSTAFTPSSDGCLIYGATTDLVNGGDTETIGTGFSLGSVDGGGLLIAKSEWREQTTAASVAATFTSTTNPAGYITVAAAVTPATILAGIRGNPVWAYGPVPAFGNGPVPYIFFPA